MPTGSVGFVGNVTVMSTSIVGASVLCAYCKARLPLAQEKIRGSFFQSSNYLIEQKWEPSKEIYEFILADSFN